MPVYTYKCTNEKCKKQTDSIEKHEVEEIKCEACGDNAKKIFSTDTKASFQLKGRWFKEGY